MIPKPTVAAFWPLCRAERVTAIDADVMSTRTPVA